MCQILKLPQLLSSFLLSYLIGVSEEQGLSLCTDYFEKFPKDSVSKKDLGVQTVWQGMKGKVTGKTPCESKLWKNKPL